MAKNKSETRVNAERIIIAIVFIIAAAIIGYAIMSGVSDTPKYTAAKTKEQRIKNTVSLQNEIFSNSSATPDSYIININTATKSELENLEGIGDKKAQAIIDYREANGSFQSIEDIMNVTGIGEKIFLNIKDKITVE